jgi:hypothetical protein
MTKDQILKEVGATITAKIEFTWITKQTLDQFIEIRDGETPTYDDFLEYVESNAFENIKNLLESDKLWNEIHIFSDNGDEIWGQDL